MRTRSMRMVAAAEHEAHEREVDDPGELLAHLVAMHGYTEEQLRGGFRSFLAGVHLRAHHRMPGA